MKREVSKEELSIKPTIQYHSIKTILFAILFICSAIPATLYTILGERKEVIATVISIAVANLILFLWSLGIIIAVYVLKNRCLDFEDKICDDEDRCQQKEGGQGTGKSDLTKRIAIIKAEHQYKLLCEEYQLHYNLLSEYIRNNDKRKLEAWEECSKAYEFYDKNPNIFPCLVSNVPMCVDGKEVMQFDFAMLIQEATLGYRCVLLIDEAKNAGLSNADSGNIPEEMDEMFRFIRQFFNGYIYTTEQNKNKLVLEFRNVSVNYTMIAMDKNILKPRLLINKLERMKDKFDEKNGYSTYKMKIKSSNNYLYDYDYINFNDYDVDDLLQLELLEDSYIIDKCFELDIKMANKILALETKINNIGFIKYIRRKSGGTEGNILVQEKDERCYMSSNRRYESGDYLTGSFPFVLGKENRKLTCLKVIVDYSCNVNDLTFDCLTFREGSWTYNEFDNEGKVIYSEDSQSGTTSRFVYDKNNNVIKTIVVDKQYREYINTSEYNKQNRLIRSTDYNGLCEEIMYDEKGRAVKTVTYNINDPTSKYYSESIRDDKGRVTADIDITGEFNSSEYKFDHKGAVNVVTDANGSKTAFGYNADGELASISSSADGEENSNTIQNTLGFVTKISSGGTDYNFTYDKWGKQKDISIAGNNYSSTEYVDDKTIKVTLGTGEAFTEYAYGKDDQTVEITLLDDSKFDCKTAKSYYTPKNGTATEQAVNYYDNNTGLLIRSVDKSSQNHYNTEYIYDDEGRLVCKVEDGVGQLEQDLEYDDKGGIKHNRYEINGVGMSYAYKYENATSDRQIGIVLPSGTEQKIEYDGLGRIRNISLSNNFTKDIYYAKYGDHSTKYVSSVWQGINGKRDKNTRYSYDKKGNIVSIKENGKETVRYTYDSLNRLIREDNAVFKEIKGYSDNGQPIIIAGKTETFEYDNNGNILGKTKYTYTLNEVLSGGTEVRYEYGQNGWKDQLLSYNGQEIGDYDEIGNPHVYRGKLAEWEKGRNLKSYDGHTFTYNANGIRTSKIVNNEETTYYLDGTKIIAEEKRDKTTGNLIDAIYYHYGFDGVTGFEYRTNLDTPGEVYIYRKNIQGDITHIYTKSGELIAEYIYDAHGNHNVSAVTRYEDLAERNAFRYRGYYYDVTTKLYYLNSRYYDPQVGRFINADALNELNPESINGLNLYAYCLNNPVNLSDSTGHSPLPWWGKILVGIGIIAVLAVATVLTAGIAGVGIGVAFSAGFAGAAVGVGASGLAVTIAAGAFAGAVIGAGIGFGIGALTGGLSTGAWQGALDGAAGGFMMGAITGAVTGSIRGSIEYKNTTPLFRAMSKGEANSLAKSGNFSTKLGQAEGKYFATSKANAMKWGNKMFSEPFRVVGTRVSSSGLSNALSNGGAHFFNYTLDGIGNAYYIDTAIINAIIRSIWFI